MPLYAVRITHKVYESAEVEIEADSPDAALEKAAELDNEPGAWNDVEWSLDDYTGPNEFDIIEKKTYWDHLLFRLGHK